MKIENKTHWDTKQLRAIIQRVAENELEPAARRKLQIVITYNRQKDGGSCSGLGSLTRPWIKLMVPSQVIDHVDFAHTAAHEMAHTRGMQHHQMTKNPLYSRVGDWRERYAWAEGMPIEKEQAKAKLKPDVQTSRYLNVLTREKAWMTKLKRAQTALKKLRAKRRYYERALATAGKLPENHQ